MGGRRAWLVFLVGLMAAPSSRADDPASFVAEALGRRIIGPELGLEEVRKFCERKVPRMPEIRDLDEWRRLADRMRAETLAQVVYRGEAAKWRELPTRVEWLETIPGGPGYRIKKLRYEAVPGFWVPALLYEPERLEGKVPAVLNFDGHDSEGMFAGYKQVRCINLAKRGMFALNVDWIGMGQLRSPENNHGILNHLDLCGTSGVAVFYSLQTRGVDVLRSLAQVDPARIAATGLSGGGWQTIFLGALDPRVALTVPVAGYSSFLTRSRFGSDLGDSEQTPVGLATVTDYALMTAMLAPRAALLTFNAKDNCCFAADHAPAPLLEAAEPIYRLYGRESHLRSHVNHDPGTHNYLKDNREALYRMIGDEFFPGQSSYSAEEIPSDTEIQPASQLQVTLPPDQATLHSLALALALGLPEDPEIPQDEPAARDWRDAKRELLAEIVQSHPYSIRAEPAGEESRDGVWARSWKFHADMDWTIPALELSRGEPKATTILLLDAGRKAGRVHAERLLDRGRRVIAIDPFDVGESKIAEKGWLWNLYVSTVGERPVGISASQIAAIARWSASTTRGSVSIVAIGPGASLTTLIATGLEPGAIQDIELEETPSTLKSPILANLPFEKAPASYCFGLLKTFDIPQLAALAAPRRVTIQFVK